MHHSLLRRRAGRIIFCFFFPATGFTVSGTQNLDKRAVSTISGSSEGMGVVDEPVLSHTLLSPVSSCRWFENATNRTTHAPSARTQVSATHTPTPLRTGNEMPESGPCVPRRCPTPGMSGFVGATSTVPGSLASASQPVSLAPPNHQTRLCDSVSPVTSQVPQHPLYFGEGGGCSCLASRDRSPAGEGRD